MRYPRSIPSGNGSRIFLLETRATANFFRIPLSRKLNWLNYMLWGGAVLLAFEHIWHGEVTPWFPFLTAMSDPQDASEMFHEMATVGVSMSVLVTGIWAVMCAAADAVVKRAKEARAMKTM